VIFMGGEDLWNKGGKLRKGVFVLSLDNAR
jgi:hypothetical protein